VEAALSTITLMYMISALLNFGCGFSVYLCLPTVGCVACAAWTGVEAASSFETEKSEQIISIAVHGGRTNPRGLRGIDLFEYGDVTTDVVQIRVTEVFSEVFSSRFGFMWMAWLAVALLEKYAGYSVFGSVRKVFSPLPRLIMVFSFIFRIVSFIFWFYTLCAKFWLPVLVLESMTPKTLSPCVLFFLWLTFKLQKTYGGKIMFWKLGEMCRSQPRCKPVRALVLVTGMMYPVLLWLFGRLPSVWRWSLIMTHTIRALNVLSSIRREMKGANVRGIFGRSGVQEGVRLPA